MSENTSASPANTPSHSRGWLIAGGLLSIFVGFLALGSPLFFSVVLAQFLGIFALVSGVISLFVAIFSKQVTHRVLERAAGIDPHHRVNRPAAMHRLEHCGHRADFSRFI